MLWNQKSYNIRVPVMAEQKWIHLGTMRLQVRSLASLNGLRIQGCHELWYSLQTRLGSAWLWLWRGPEAIALIRPLAWEPPFFVALKRQKDKKKFFFNHTNVEWVKKYFDQVKLKWLVQNHTVNRNKSRNRTGASLTLSSSYIYLFYKYLSSAFFV